MGTTVVTRNGTVYLVGAGPGDPGLLTLRGRQCLENADVVLYDYLVNPRLLEWASNAEKICLGRHGRTKIWTQAEINTKLIQLAQAGLQVVRLKSGDPIVFARGAEEARALTQFQVQVEIVPGVTSALAAGSCAGIALTHRDFAPAVALVTGHERDNKASPLDFATLAQFPGTLAVYMGVTTAPSWTAELLAGGMPGDTPAVLVRRVSFCDQQTWCGTLAEVAGHIESTKLRPPVIALVGPAVNQDSALGWFEGRSLFGQRILVTRPSHSATDVAAQLEELGAEVAIQPAIEVAPPSEWRLVDCSIDKARDGDFDWIVFSSPNGVRFWMDRWLESGDVRGLAACRIAAVGKATARSLRAYGLHPDLVPEVFHADALAESLKEAWTASQAAPLRVLLIRASRGRDVLRTALEADGASVEQVVAYQNRDVSTPAPHVIEQVESGAFDWITVTSSAIAKSLHRMFGAALHGAQLVSISPITSSALRECGLEPAAEAATHDMDGVVNAIVDAVQGVSS